MTTQEALARWDEVSRTRVVVADEPTPTYDALTKLRAAMADVHAALCDLGVNDRMNLTLGDVTELVRIFRDTVS